MSDRPERNQHRRTHELQLHADNLARIEAERADMARRWGLATPGDRDIPKLEAGFPVRVRADVEQRWAAALALEARS